MTKGEKAEEKKTERFNMFISPSELKAIDDWRFANRVNSLSEAMRRLVQIAIETEASIDRAGELANDLLRIYNTALTGDHVTLDSLIDAIAVPVLELAGHVNFITTTKDTIKSGTSIEAAGEQLEQVARRRDALIRNVQKFVGENRE